MKPTEIMFSGKCRLKLDPGNDKGGPQIEKKMASTSLYVFLVIIVLETVQGLFAPAKLCPRCTDPYDPSSCTETQNCYDTTDQCELIVNTADRHRVSYICHNFRYCTNYDIHGCPSTSVVCTYCCRSVDDCLAQLQELFSVKFTSKPTITTSTTTPSTTAMTTTTLFTTTPFDDVNTTTSVPDTTFIGTSSLWEQSSSVSSDITLTSVATTVISGNNSTLDATNPEVIETTLSSEVSSSSGSTTDFSSTSGQTEASPSIPSTLSSPTTTASVESSTNFDVSTITYEDTPDFTNEYATGDTGSTFSEASTFPSLTSTLSYKTTTITDYLSTHFDVSSTTYGDTTTLESGETDLTSTSTEIDITVTDRTIYTLSTEPSTTSDQTYTTFSSTTTSTIGEISTTDDGQNTSGETWKTTEVLSTSGTTSGAISGTTSGVANMTSEATSTTSGFTNPSVANECIQCGDPTITENCKPSELVGGTPTRCPSTKPYCYSVVSHNDTEMHFYKGCQDDTFCFTEWWQTTKPNAYCNPPDISTSDQLKCTFCCQGSGCNSKIRPDDVTLLVYQ